MYHVYISICSDTDYTVGDYGRLQETHESTIRILSRDHRSYDQTEGDYGRRRRLMYESTACRRLWKTVGASLRL